LTNVQGFSYRPPLIEDFPADPTAHGSARYEELSARIEGKSPGEAAGDLLGPVQIVGIQYHIQSWG